MKAIVLFSGGMDSTTLLAQAINKHDEVIALSILYGSKHNEVESKAAQEICDFYKIQRIKLDIDFNTWGFKSDLLTSGGDVPEGHYADESMTATVVPFRNGILLSIATGIAESLEAGVIYYGAHGGDHPIYPDCRPEFVEAMRTAIATGTGNSVTMDAPFSEIDKTEIAKLGHALNVPFERTWSCYQPVATEDDYIHCGRCGTCVERIEAFTDSNVPDLTKYQTTPTPMRTAY
tara:strand:+ start:1915 stop:2613 length:699 start_codon:yes stop_codon:yes gene_type:complete